MLEERTKGVYPNLRRHQLVQQGTEEVVERTAFGFMQLALSFHDVDLSDDLYLLVEA